MLFRAFFGLVEDAVVRTRVLRSSLSGKVSIWTSFCRQNSRHTQLHRESFPDKCMRKMHEKITSFLSPKQQTIHTQLPPSAPLCAVNPIFYAKIPSKASDNNMKTAQITQKILIFTQIAFVHSSYQLHIIWEVIWMH